MHTPDLEVAWAGGHSEWMRLAGSLTARLGDHLGSDGRPWVFTTRPSTNGRVIDEMEAVSRSFLLAALHAGPVDAAVSPDGTLDRLVGRIVAGCDPRSPQRWPRIDDGRSNTVVESASLSLGFWLTRDRVWARLGESDRRHIVSWLRPALDLTTAANNWILFPVVASCFLDAVGEGDGRSRQRIEVALARINGWRTDSGWFSDGAGRTFDYYNSWALHFYPVLLSWLLPDSALLHDQRPVLTTFLADFRAFFAEDGGQVYFGRSLVYRFAASAAFSVAALADCAPGPTADCRVYASRNVDHFLRRGAGDGDVPLTLGWFGADHRLAQPYSGQMGGLWAVKTFVNLLIPAGDPYWQPAPPPTPPPPTVAIPGPHLLLSRNPDGSVVQLVNHGTQNYDAATRRGPVDDKLYSRISYSTATAPVDGPAGRDSGLYFRTRFGRGGRRAVTPRGMGPGWAASRRVHGTPNPLHIPGRIGYQAQRLLPTGPSLDLGLASDELTFADGNWLVHLYRPSTDRQRWITGLEMSGWGIPDAVEVTASPEDDRPAVRVGSATLVSVLVALTDGQTMEAVQVHDASPFGARTTFARSAAGYRHDAVYAVATFLGTPADLEREPRPPRLTLTPDGPRVDWADGRRTRIRPDLAGPA